ncbi:non-canonical purine NTP pyrophosphatase [Gardnerella vaginalis]|uniref:dITP/XTP pyrophosphatase n=1 Tax=Gardnerella vaginalis TaxID=2702 RepID=A0A3E1IQA8_GARVA|nr:non-canonical purine NTP pyrophosphatase [Gardnerella vaginalis]MBF9308134.1 non-canonical purine NTP pyrophosphatase [Bifidobacteriaceae bacterium NR043]MBF9354096.1 non-canonical purine NTP pyrophosphatase [Bifidobacteriaceae bacterium NR044]RFD75147.1 non-canonical purine NTP pyrophosphatase [Gardnerella vaginalis]RFT37988.1 non-canonical purine NTP pyrophosphatase [Bifidobacteriaceae bacterium NR003]
MKLVVATHNEGKLVEIKRILAEQLNQLADRFELITAGSLGLPDPVETGVTFEQNALLKARDVASRTGLPAIADDSGIIVDVLGAAPGILSARWSGVHGDDKANNALLLQQLSDIPDRFLTARFRCAAALAIPDACSEVPEGSVMLHTHGFETVRMGEMIGHLLREERGTNGFGYDPLFVPDEQPIRNGVQMEGLTSAELTQEEKNSISHRGHALRALLPELQALFITE